MIENKHSEEMLKMIKRIGRAGNNFIGKVIDNRKNRGWLSGEEALSIFNAIGIPIEIIYLIANSHDLPIDMEDFYKCLEEQKNISKGMKQCFRSDL